MDSIIFPFTLKRADGEEKELFFEPEPDWILIKATRSEEEFWAENRHKPLVATAPKECFDRFDFNDRGRQVWNAKMWIWLKKQMEDFSNGMTVSAYYINPYYAIGGFIP